MKKAFTLIELMIVIAIIAIIAAIAIPNLLEARKHGNEASAIGSMRTINASHAIYIERNSSQTYATSLKDLETDGYVDNVLGGGAKQGYLFATKSRNPYEYVAVAKPAVGDQTGNRHFFTNQSGVIRFANNVGAGPDSPAIGGK
jgi:type IV pilus assembly protein PilA